MKIMIVDDQSTVLQSLKEAIEPSGHDCTCFDQPELALQNFINYEFDTVITDYKMPKMNGIELLCAIQKQKPGTPVIMFTGYAEINNIIDAVNFGVFAFFRKPVNIRDMMKTLDKIKTLVETRKQREIEFTRLDHLYKSHFLDVQHRIRNTLQIISSLTSLQISLQQNQDNLTLLRTHENRIKVIGMSYEIMNQSINTTVIDLNVFIQKLVNFLYCSYAPASSKIQPELLLDTVQIPIDQAIPLGLALNEIISNTFLHAFPENWSGDARLLVSLKQQGDRIHIVINDNGVGLSASADPSRASTMGFMLVYSLIVNQLGGQVNYKSDRGVSFTLIISC